MGIGYYKAYSTYMELMGRPMLQDNPECVKKSINTIYWKAQDAIQRASGDQNQTKYIILSVAIGIVFVLSLVLFTIYFKRKGNDESETSEQLTEED